MAAVNKDQIGGMVRIILPALLGMIGYNAVSPEDMGSTADAIVNVGYSAVTLGMLVWSWHRNKTTVQIDNVSKMKEVLQPIVTTPEIANVALKDNPNVVSAPPAALSIWDLK